MIDLACLAGVTSLISARPIKPGGQLRLGADMEPGKYVLLAVVTDNLAKNKYLAATQSMDFEVTP